MQSGMESFALYDLEVEVIKKDRSFVCSHHVGAAFRVEGENLVFPKGCSFSLYSLSALLPLLPAKQRETHENDWMTSDECVACPDPYCGALFRIRRTGRRTFLRSETTVTKKSTEI